MKKTLLALVVAAFAASSAQAAAIYNKDGSKVDIDGRLAFQIAKHTDKRTDLVDKGSRVRIRAYQEITPQINAFGAFEIRFTQHGTFGDGIHTKRLFGGFQHKDIGTLSFGRQLIVGDHIGLSDFTYELGAIVKVTDAHNKAIHFMSKEFDGFRFGADYLFGNAQKYDAAGNQTADTGKGFNLGAFYQRKLGDFTFKTEGGYGEITKGTLDSNEYKAKLAGAAVGFDYANFGFGFDWARANSPQGHADHTFRVGPVKSEKVNQFEVGLKYQITPNNKVYAEYLWGQGKNRGEADKAKFNGWFLGADHYFNKSVLVYVEGGSFKTKKASETLAKEKRIAIGTRIYF